MTQADAISGHPLDSVVQLVAMLAAHGQELPAGSLVLAGAATVAEVQPAVALDVDRLEGAAIRAV